MTHNGKQEAGGAFVELLIGVAVALVVLLVAGVATSQATQQAAKIREENSLEDTHSHISEHFYNDFASAGQDVVQLNTEPANSTTYFDEVMADAPKLYWRLDEPAGVIRVADEFIVDVMPKACGLTFDDLSPIEHFLQVGAGEGKNPHPLFDTRFYLSRYPDVARCNPLVHYLRYGSSEGRQPHPLFDPAFYVGRYPDQLGIHTKEGACQIDSRRLCAAYAFAKSVPGVRAAGS